MTKQRVRVDATGTLVYYPSQPAVPTSATVTLFYPGAGTDGSQLQASANATIDLTSTTVATAAVKGATSFSVAAASGGSGGTAWAIASGTKYLITESAQTWVCEARLVSGTTVYPVVPIPFAFTTNTTVKGIKLSYALTTTHTDVADDDYRAAWQFTQNSATVQEDQLFDVVSVPEYYVTTYDDVVMKHPRIAKLLKSQDTDLYGPLRWTWNNELIPMLRSAEIDIYRVKDFSQLVPLHVALVYRWAALQDFEADPARQPLLDAANSEVAEAFDNFKACVEYDADDDRGISPDEAKTAFTMRFTR